MQSLNAGQEKAACPESPLQPARPVELEEFNPGLIPV